MTEPRKALDMAAITAAADCKVKVVDVPEWGGVVGLRPMTGADRDDWENENYHRHSANEGRADLRMLRARYLSMVLVHAETGELLFQGEEGRKKLSVKNGHVLNRLYEIAEKMNLLGAKAIDEEKKG